MNDQFSGNGATFPGEKEVQELLVQLFQPAVNKIGVEVSGSIGDLKKPLKNISDGVAGIEDLVKSDNFDRKVLELKKVISDFKDTISIQISEGVKNNSESYQQNREKIVLHIDEVFQLFKALHEESVAALQTECATIRDKISKEFEGLLKEIRDADLKKKSTFRTIKAMLIIIALLQAISMVLPFFK